MAMSPVKTNEVQVEGVRCSDTAIMEIDSGKVMVTIPIQDVRRISLRHGIQAPNPMIQVIVGAALSLLGVFPVMEFYRWTRTGGVLFAALHWLLIPAVIGVWTMGSALKRGYFLEVQVDKGTRRLAFHKRPDAEALNHLVASIETRAGVPVLRA